MSDLTKDKMLACPFCGSTTAMRVGTSDDVNHEPDCECRGIGDDYWAVFCDASTDAKLGGCGASGGFQKTKALAIELWNRRAAHEPSGWQPIETAPKYKELLLYREDAGVMWGIYTSPDQFTPESHWDETAAELGDSFEQEDWFLYCWDGAVRVEGEENPSHWMPLSNDPGQSLETLVELPPDHGGGLSLPKNTERSRE